MRRIARIRSHSIYQFLSVRIGRLPMRLAALCAAGFVSGCGGGSSNDGGNLSGTEVDTGSGSIGALLAPKGINSPDVVALKAAVADGAYADVLVDCVSVEAVAASCTLNTLPLLVQEASAPTVDDILARTVVSHEWMAIRFRELLVALPADMLPLFGATTAVVIAADIRPSYYTGLTGAIYLDPADLWLTNAEKNTISRQDDFRSGYGTVLSFVPLWRYVDGAEYAWDYYPLDGTATRTIQDTVRPMAALLFHELAHANDFIPPAMLSGVDRSLSIVEVAESFLPRNVSARLNASQPLNSQLWIDMGQTLFWGVGATAEQQSLSATQVGLEFENDGANAAYSYSTIYEDTAMLFEEVMVKHYFDVNLELAFTDAPPEGLEQYCDSYTVRWGYRNRVNETLVRSRAEQAIQLLLNKPDVSSYLASLDAPRKMTNGTDWCTIQPLGAPFNAAPSAAMVPDSAQAPRTLRPDNRRRYH